MRSTRNFIRKWGHFVKHDSLLKPIVPPKYNIKLEVVNSSFNLLYSLEPWCDIINLDLNQQEIQKYIDQEQVNTVIPLKDRINQNIDSDITIKIDGTTFTDNDFKYLQSISEILKNNGSIGEFQLENLFISIKSLNELTNNLIKL